MAFGPFPPIRCRRRARCAPVQTLTRTLRCHPVKVPSHVGDSHHRAYSKFRKRGILVVGKLTAFGIEMKYAAIAVGRIIIAVMPGP